MAGSCTMRVSHSASTATPSGGLVTGPRGHQPQRSVALASLKTRTQPAGTVSHACRTLSHPSTLSISRRYQRSARNTSKSSTQCTASSSANEESSAECPLKGSNSPTEAAADGSSLRKLLAGICTLSCTAAAYLLLQVCAVPLVVKWLGTLAAGIAALDTYLRVSQKVLLRQYGELSLPPMVSEHRLPLIGHVLNIMNPEFYTKMTAKYGDTWTMASPLQSPNPVACINGGSDVRSLLMKEHKAIDSAWPDTVYAILGRDAVFSLKGKEHTKMRQVHNGCLNKDSVKQIGTPIMADLLDKYAQTQWEGTEMVDVLAMTRDFSFDVFLNYILGVQVERHVFESLRADFDTVGAGVFAPALGTFGPYHQAQLARQRMGATLAGIYEAQLPLYEAGEMPASSALYQMIEAGRTDGFEVTAQMFEDNMFNLLWAATETTSSVLLYIFKRLHESPEVLQALRAEHDSLTAGAPRAPGSGYPVGPYTSAFVQEMLRVYSVVPTIFRKTVEDVTLSDGFTIPAGWSLVLNLQLTTFENIPVSTAVDAPPEEFCVERWLDVKAPEGYLPFGHGPRICSGMALAIAELEQAAAMIAGHYDLIVVEPADKKMKPTDGNAIKGIFVKLSPRADRPADRAAEGVAVPV